MGEPGLRDGGKGGASLGAVVAAAERAEHEALEVTRLEKVLAAGLVLFMLIGGAWVLGRLGRIPRAPDSSALMERHGIPPLEQELSRLNEMLAVADRGYREARSRADEAQREYEFRREEYRTRLDAVVVDPSLRQA